ncbi:MAG: chemotaxis protein MotB [Halioglobus sp.]
MIVIEEADDGPTGTPAWMATFADLMSLLMCFFVLLLSFSQLDAQKYKQVAGSMKNAFGVQNQVKVMGIPKGTSIIAKEFSPGKPQPTQIKTVNQFTTETTKASLSVGNPTAPKSEGKDMDGEEAKRLLEKKLNSLMVETRIDAEKLRAVLKDEIDSGKIDIESRGRSITIRIREKGSFSSGSAALQDGFIPIMSSLRGALSGIPGEISVEGHTDNIPIESAQYKSNWHLSSSRALSVTHELVKNSELESDRFRVVGRADTEPFQPNDSSQNRAQNRRVEIVIRQGLDDATVADIAELKRRNPGAIDSVTLDVGEDTPSSIDGIL